MRQKNLYFNITHMNIIIRITKNTCSYVFQLLLEISDVGIFVSLEINERISFCDIFKKISR